MQRAAHEFAARMGFFDGGPQARETARPRGPALHAVDQRAAQGEIGGEHGHRVARQAEELRMAQKSLGTITGEFSADDLLGEIFGRFCIGK